MSETLGLCHILVAPRLDVDPKKGIRHFFHEPHNLSSYFPRSRP